MRRPSDKEIREAFELLNVRPDELRTERDVNRRANRFLQHLHPDVGGSTKLSQQVNAARDVLIYWIKAGRPVIGSADNDAEPDPAPEQPRARDKEKEEAPRGRKREQHQRREKKEERKRAREAANARLRELRAAAVQATKRLALAALRHCSALLLRLARATIAAEDARTRWISLAVLVLVIYFGSF
jgi:hypothetical protein